MKVRTRRRVSNRVDTVRVQTVLVRESIGLLTLDDPKLPTKQALGAFVRLRPPEGLPDSEIDSWRNLVAKVAIAVKVLPSPQAADVPTASHRVEEGIKVGSVREEALTLAEATGDVAVVQLTTKILDEVGL